MAEAELDASLAVGTRRAGVPDLTIHPSRQRYTYLETLPDGNRLIRFESVGEGEDFVADIVFAANGLVLDYPGIATRIGKKDDRS